MHVQVHLIHRVATGQGEVREGEIFFKVGEKSEHFELCHGNSVF